MQIESMRENLFTIRMSTEETERAERVAKRYGITVAALIRMLIKRDEDAENRRLELDQLAASRGISEATKRRYSGIPSGASSAAIEQVRRYKESKKPKK